MMTGLFEQSVAFMRAQQEQLASQMSSSLAQTPWNVFDPAQMQAMQAEFQKRLAGMWTGMPGMPGMPPMPGAAPARKPEAAASSASAADAAELKALRERLEELEKKLPK
jgi:hypothetical protein